MQIKKIICSIDFSQHSQKVAQYALIISEALKAEVTVLYVAPSMKEYADFETSPALVDKFVEKIAMEARDNMDKFISQHFKTVPAIGRVEKGYAAELILSVANSLPADLIVMGTHGRTGFNRLVFGSVAEKVIKTSQVPVLTVRPSTDDSTTQ